MTEFRHKDVVWCKCGGLFWPGEVRSIDSLPQAIREGFLKTPLVVVKFFEEEGYEFVLDKKHIFPYKCDRKEEFILKGLARARTKAKEGATGGWFAKFPKDVVHCEKVTKGNVNILKEDPFVERKEKKVDYSLIFGDPEEINLKKSASLKNLKRGNPKTDNDSSSTNDTSEEIQLVSKKITHPRFLGGSDHCVRILTQPSTPYHIDTKSEDGRLKSVAPKYSCHLCDFAATRVNVIILHNKSHSAPERTNLANFQKPHELKKSGSKTVLKIEPSKKRERAVSPKTRFNSTKRMKYSKKGKKVKLEIKKEKVEKHMAIFGDWSEDENEEEEEKEKLKVSIKSTTSVSDIESDISNPCTDNSDAHSVSSDDHIELESSRRSPDIYKSSSFSYSKPLRKRKAVIESFVREQEKANKKKMLKNKIITKKTETVVDAINSLIKTQLEPNTSQTLNKEVENVLKRTPILDTKANVACLSVEKSNITTDVSKSSISLKPMQSIKEIKTAIKVSNTNETKAKPEDIYSTCFSSDSGGAVGSSSADEPSTPPLSPPHITLKKPGILKKSSHSSIQLPTRPYGDSQLIRHESPTGSKYALISAKAKAKQIARTHMAREEAEKRARQNEEVTNHNEKEKGDATYSKSTLIELSQQKNMFSNVLSPIEIVNPGQVSSKIEDLSRIPPSKKGHLSGEVSSEKNLLLYEETKNGDNHPNENTSLYNHLIPTENPDTDLDTVILPTDLSTNIRDQIDAQAHSLTEIVDKQAILVSKIEEDIHKLKEKDECSKEKSLKEEELTGIKRTETSLKYVQKHPEISKINQTQGIDEIPNSVFKNDFKLFKSEAQSEQTIYKKQNKLPEVSERKESKILVSPTSQLIDLSNKPNNKPVVQNNEKEQANGNKINNQTIEADMNQGKVDSTFAYLPEQKSFKTDTFSKETERESKFSNFAVRGNAGTEISNTPPSTLIDLSNKISSKLNVKNHLQENPDDLKKKASEHVVGLNKTKIYESLNYPVSGQKGKIKKKDNRLAVMESDNQEKKAIKEDETKEDISNMLHSPGLIDLSRKTAEEIKNKSFISEEDMKNDTENSPIKSTNEGAIQASLQMGTSSSKTIYLGGDEFKNNGAYVLKQVDVKPSVANNLFSKMQVDVSSKVKDKVAMEVRHNIENQITEQGSKSSKLVNVKNEIVHPKKEMIHEMKEINDDEQSETELHSILLTNQSNTLFQTKMEQCENNSFSSAKNVFHTIETCTKKEDVFSYSGEKTVDKSSASISDPKSDVLLLTKNLESHPQVNIQPKQSYNNLSNKNSLESIILERSTNQAKKVNEGEENKIINLSESIKDMKSVTMIQTQKGLPDQSKNKNVLENIIMEISAKKEGKLSELDAVKMEEVSLSRVEPDQGTFLPAKTMETPYTGKDEQIQNPGKFSAQNEAHAKQNKTSSLQNEVLLGSYEKNKSDKLSPIKSVNSVDLISLSKMVKINQRDTIEKCETKNILSNTLTLERNIPKSSATKEESLKKPKFTMRIDDLISHDKSVVSNDKIQRAMVNTNSNELYSRSQDNFEHLLFRSGKETSKIPFQKAGLDKTSSLAHLMETQKIGNLEISKIPIVDAGAEQQLLQVSDSYFNMTPSNIKGQKIQQAIDNPHPLKSLLSTSQSSTIIEKSPDTHKYPKPISGLLRKDDISKACPVSVGIISSPSILLSATSSSKQVHKSPCSTPTIISVGSNNSAFLPKLQQKPVETEILVSDLSKPVVSGLSKPSISLMNKPGIPAMSKPSIPLVSKVIIPVVSKPSIPLVSIPCIPLVSKPSIPLASKLVLPGINKTTVDLLCKPVVAGVSNLIPSPNKPFIAGVNKPIILGNKKQSDITISKPLPSSFKPSNNLLSLTSKHEGLSISPVSIPGDSGQIKILSSPITKQPAEVSVGITLEQTKPQNFPIERPPKPIVKTVELPKRIAEAPDIGQIVSKPNAEAIPVTETLGMSTTNSDRLMPSDNILNISDIIVSIPSSNARSEANAFVITTSNSNIGSSNLILPIADSQTGVSCIPPSDHLQFLTAGDGGDSDGELIYLLVDEDSDTNLDNQTLYIDQAQLAAATGRMIYGSDPNTGSLLFQREHSNQLGIHATGSESATSVLMQAGERPMVLQNTEPVLLQREGGQVVLQDNASISNVVLVDDKDHSAANLLGVVASADTTGGVATLPAHPSSSLLAQVPLITTPSQQGPIMVSNTKDEDQI